MEKHKVMSQMKGQDKTPEKRNTVETHNLPEKELRILLVKMIQDLRKTMEKMFTKDLQELKNKQTEMNNALEGIHSRITEAEARINDLEDRTVEITIAEQKIEKKNEKKWRQPKTSGTILNATTLSL